MAQANTVADAVKSVLAPSIVEGFRALGKEVGGNERSARGRWVKFRAKFQALAAEFPRLADGSIDRKSDSCEEARLAFMDQAVLGLTEGPEYDRPLHQSGENEFHVPSDSRPANFTLTGRNAVSMDAKSLKAMPNSVDAPLGLRRFVEATQKTVENTATKAWGRFFEADFADKTNSARGVNSTVDEWIDGLAKPMTAKLGAARKTGRKVATNDGAKKALAQFRKALLG